MRINSDVVLARKARRDVEDEMLESSLRKK